MNTHHHPHTRDYPLTLAYIAAVATITLGFVAAQVIGWL